MNTTALTPTTADPLRAYTVRQIIDRLRSALAIAHGNLAADRQRFRTLLDDVLSRTDALDLAQTPTAVDADKSPDDSADSAQPQVQFTISALTSAEHQPVSEFLLIPFGAIAVERPVAGADFVFTSTHAEQARRWFDTMQRKLAIDYEHQSFDDHNTRADGLRPAAGWIGGLEVRDDGLWATDVQWTDRARELLRTGEYRYFSPVIFWTNEDQIAVAALGPVALTNDPAMRGVKPLAATRNLNDDIPDNADTTDADEHSDDAPVTDPALQSARQEISQLRRQLALQEADTFVERGLRQGKVVESTSMDWRNDYLRDPQGAVERLTRAPILLPPGRMVALDRRGHVAPLGAPTSTPNDNVIAARADQIESADLDAYDRATAAGRVRHAGGTTLPAATRTSL